ncbi:hypothetical protein [Allokutzneria oryzae]|uniref:Uncharacterized protein n=1 Tax=Allokutzneria oryzae TaxID=1378989 RepID=A0ABV6A3V9_9PSEU
MSPTAEYTVRRMSARYIRELVSGPSRQATLKRLQAKPVPPGKPGVDFSQDIRVNRPHAWYGTGSNDWNHQGTIHGGITLIRRSAFTDYPTTGPSDPARSPRRYLITVELGDLEEPYPVKLKPEQHVFVHWNGERETRASFEASIGDGSAAGTPHSVVKRIQLANPDTGLSTCVDWTDQALAAGGYSSPFDLAMLPALIPQPVSDGRGACGLPVT